MQWCNDFKKTIIKLKSYLKKDGFLIISTFLKGNLFELGDIFGVELKYIELEDIKKIFTNGEIISKEEKSPSFDKVALIHQIIKLIRN